jgi:hypothetical protein
VVRFLLVEKSDKIKSVREKESEVISIDVNLWFKSNNLTPDCMNEIRQYIFEEWLIKKIQSNKNKIESGTIPVIIYNNVNEAFISLLRKKITESLEIEDFDLDLFQ